MIVCSVIVYFIISRCYSGKGDLWVYLYAGTAAVLTIGIIDRLGYDFLVMHDEIPLQYNIFISTIGNVNFWAGYLSMLIPFSGGKYWDIGWLAVPLLFIAVIGTVNGTNFTDGLDGLASSVTVLVATFFTVVAIGTKSGVEPITCAVVGALLGFLLFNVYPASVFMGDTGSLALGGFVAGTAYMMQMPLFIIIVGLIYLVEVASVMIQVTYFKKTGGKRFFKMAPIHHHFELCGWSETRVVAVFSIVTALLCLIALMGV